MKVKFLLISLLTTITLAAQNLKTFSVTMLPDSNRYISIKNMKTYNENDAVDVKALLDLALVLTSDENKNTLEWYNLKPDNEKVPESLTGTKTGIVTMSFDKDQFDKCKTAADIDRMTGHISKNSFSHFAVIGYNGKAEYPCSLFLQETGKKGLIYVTGMNGKGIQVAVKVQP